MTVVTEGDKDRGKKENRKKSLHKKVFYLLFIIKLIYV